MKVENNISLRQYNTFGIDVKAKLFSTFTNPETLQQLIADHSKQPTMILGGGSNVLFTKDFDGLVLKNEIKGIELIKEDANHIYVKAGAGENWHAFVQYALERNWAGLENLSLIPGNVGAVPCRIWGLWCGDPGSIRRVGSVSHKG